MLKIKVLPANCGDCIIISFDDGDRIKNILVDGGAGTVYDDVLKDEIKRIKIDNQKIDLLIITHTDTDHIGGIIKFIEDDSLNGYIEEVWFNSWTNFDGKPVKLSHDKKEISAGSAKILENKLKRMDIWQNELIAQGICRNYNKAKIIVVSPNENSLEALRGYLKDEFKISESDDRKKKIELLQKRKFKEDKAIPNGSSIAFIFEYDSKNKILFTGDSFPSIVLEGLEKMNFIDETKKVRFDYIKVSHHASKKNTSDEFLEKIDCNNYIVTTMGCNGKPNKETFARILKHQPLNIFFNYKTAKTENIFTPHDLENYQIIQTYLEDNPEPYVIKVC